MRCFHKMSGLGALALAMLPLTAQAQSVTNMAALKGLLPVAQLLETPQGKAALAANQQVTGAIQDGSAGQALLLAFPQQQELALKDAFITFANGAELADGLGTNLGGAYQGLTGYKQAGAKQTPYGSVSPNLDLLIGYSAALTASDAASGKYFFANATIDGKKPVSPAAKALLAGASNAVFDKFNGLGGALPAPCKHEPDKFGDSRPFQTEKKLTVYSDADYFGASNSNIAYLCGPVQNLQDSPAFPSGHTTYGYTESLLFAIMVPERYSQMVTRGAEYGNDRIILGAHYAMDVIAGRTLAEYDIAHLLANAPGYTGEAHPIGSAKDAANVTVKDYPAVLEAAAKDLRQALEAQSNTKIADASQGDTTRFADPAKNEAFYEATQTYGLPVVFKQNEGKVEDVSKIAPEAGYLLTAAFPKLSLKQADDILTQTEGPGGGFLDNGSAFGLYSRLDLYKASQAAAKASAS